MTHVLAKELRDRNIPVNAITPGHTATDLFLTGKSQEKQSPRLIIGGLQLVRALKTVISACRSSRITSYFVL